MPAPFVLSFDPTESRLPIPLDIIDDQILELNEQFQLQLSVGQSDPPTGHGLGRFQSALVQIIDNEGVYLFYIMQWIWMIVSSLLVSYRSVVANVAGFIL